MGLLYICDLKGGWLDFIYTFCQLLAGFVAGALVQNVLCGVESTPVLFSPVTSIIIYPVSNTAEE